MLPSAGDGLGAQLGQIGPEPRPIHGFVAVGSRRFGDPPRRHAVEVDRTIACCIREPGIERQESRVLGIGKREVRGVVGRQSMAMLMVANHAEPGRDRTVATIWLQFE